MPPLVRGGQSLLVTIGDRPAGTGGFLNCRRQRMRSWLVGVM
jgi:hypothetical protein